MIKRSLILFSGTKSFTKELERYKVECRSVDISDKFNPTYNVDLLLWNYKEDLKDWIPNYIHCSPPCTDFTGIKNIKKHTRNIKEGLKLVEKSLEIIDYFKELNPNLKFTIENPKGLLRKQNIMKSYDKISTSYCRYGYMYRKETDFWFGGFNLELRKPCRNTKNKVDWCINKLSNNNGCHIVAIKFKKTNKFMRDIDYYPLLRKKFNIKGWKDGYFRWRIPDELIRDILRCLLN